MSVKVEQIEKNIVQLEIEVESVKFEEGMRKSYFKNAKKFNVPGFRRGKAPRNIVERYYGEQVLYEDAINFVCPEAYDRAVEEYDIHPVEKPEIDIKEIGNGKNLVFTAKVTTKPEVELGEYKCIEVKKTDVNVTDEDLEKELQKVLEQNARLIIVDDRGIQTGDTAVIDFEGFIDGKEFKGGKGKNYHLEIGSDQFIPGFEEQLLDAKTGDEVEVNVTFPEDYNNAELASKPALFKVKINEIKRKELPELDDEFAKDVSEFDTLEAYKEDLKYKLVENTEKNAMHEVEDSIVNRVVENAVVDIPPVMIDNHIDRLVRDFDMRLRFQGLDLEKYLQHVNIDIDTFRNRFVKRAENEVKTQLVLEKISRIEQITASEDTVNEQIAKMADEYKETPDNFKKQLKENDIEYIKGDIVIKETIDFLVKNANIS